MTIPTPDELGLPWTISAKDDYRVYTAFGTLADMHQSGAKDLCRRDFIPLSANHFHELYAALDALAANAACCCVDGLGEIQGKCWPCTARALLAKIDREV